MLTRMTSFLRGMSYCQHGLNLRFAQSSSDVPTFSMALRTIISLTPLL